MMSSLNRKDEEVFTSLLDSYLTTTKPEGVNKKQLTLSRNGDIVYVNEFTDHKIAWRDGYVITSEVAKLSKDFAYDFEEPPIRWFLFEGIARSQYNYDLEVSNKEGVILISRMKPWSSLNYKYINAACVRYLRPYMKKDRKFLITLGFFFNDDIRWYDTGCYAKGIEFIEIFTYKGNTNGYATDVIAIEWKD